MMVRVKICGITAARDAVMAAAAGADALGFNFWPGSKRHIEPEKARAIRLSLPPFVAAVGLFVDADVTTVRELVEYCRLDYAQLHGHEGPRTVARLSGVPIIKAIRIRTEADLVELERYNTAAAFLLDTYMPGVPGGTGMTFDWDLARMASSRAKVILAGGLTPQNVASAVEAARPYAVDVSSGVEDDIPGKKSRPLVNAFIRAAKGVEL